MRAMVLQQARDDAAPTVGGVAVAVDQEHRRAVARVDHVGLDAGDVDQAMRKLVAFRVVQTGVSDPPRHSDVVLGVNHRVRT